MKALKWFELSGATIYISEDLNHKFDISKGCRYIIIITTTVTTTTTTTIIIIILFRFYVFVLYLRFWCWICNWRVCDSGCIELLFTTTR